MEVISQLAKVDRTLLLAAQILLTSITIGLTNPHTAPRRLSSPVALYLTAAQCVSRKQDVRSQWASTLCGTSILLFLHHIDLSLLSLVQYEAGKPSENNKTLSPAEGANPSKTISACLYGFERAVSFRHIDSPTEVKNVPHFSAREKSYLPSRMTFLAQSLSKIIFCYLAVDAMHFVAPSPEETGRIFSPRSIPLTTKSENLSMESLQLRLGATLGFWVSVFCIATLSYYPVAVLAVISTLSSPRSWRPLFNSIGDLSSVRSFWGRFWHQNMRRPLSQSASFLTQKLFRLRRGTLVARYTHLFCVFTLSGVLHVLAQVAGGMPFRPANGAVHFFVTQAAGILVEDVVIYTYHRFFTARGRRAPRALEKCAGSTWLLVFLVWSTPVWMYNAAAALPPEPLVPFSIIRWFDSRRESHGAH